MAGRKEKHMAHTMQDVIRIMHSEGFPPVVVNALIGVVEARAKWETISAIDTATKTEILRENAFFDEETGDRLTNPDFDFLMGDTEFTRYCGMVYARNLDKGLDSGAPNLTFWPALKAVNDAECALIDAVAADLPKVYTPKVIQQLKASPGMRKKFFAILGL